MPANNRENTRCIHFISQEDIYIIPKPYDNEKNGSNNYKLCTPSLSCRCGMNHPNTGMVHPTSRSCPPHSK